MIFSCRTANGISHPLLGVHYVLRSDQNILVGTAYNCFLFGQIAYTTMEDKNVESPQRVSSAMLRGIELPRLERYITNEVGTYITYIPFERFGWEAFGSQRGVAHRERRDGHWNSDTHH